MSDSTDAHNKYKKEFIKNTDYQLIFDEIAENSGIHNANPKRFSGKDLFKFLIDLVGKNKLAKFKLLVRKSSVEWGTFRQCQYRNISADKLEIIICLAAQASRTPLLQLMVKLIEVQNAKHVKLDVVEKHSDIINCFLEENSPKNSILPKNSDPISSNYEKSLTIDSSPIKLVHGKDTWLNPYNPDAIPFVGRNDELKRLDEFAKHQDQFKIWAVIGPSGAGKTRLAIEWISNSSILEGWKTHTLSTDDKNLEIWSKWTPSQPTLLLIDYMFGFDEVIQKISLRFQNVVDDSNSHPVRLLILDHVFPDNLKQLKDDPKWGFSNISGQQFDSIKPLFFEEKPLNLVKTKDQDIIISSIIAKLAGDNVSESLVKDAKVYLQKTITGAWHPLFAALLGDALRNGREYHKWNRRDLIYYYLEDHDRLPWKKGDAANMWASCFVAAATVRRGIDFDTLISCLPARNEESPVDYSSLIETSSRIVSSNDHTTLPPFEPDILGESFFLLFIQQLRTNPILRSTFIKMLVGGDYKKCVRDIIEINGFLLRLTRNLSNDEQKLPETRKHWDTLLFFLSPQMFPAASFAKLAITSGLIDIAYLIKKKPCSIDYKNFLDKVDTDELFETSKTLRKIRLFSHAFKRLKLYRNIRVTSLLIAVMQYFELNRGTSFQSQKLRKKIISFLKRYEKITGQSALIIAIRSRFAHTALSLITKRSYINKVNSNGTTPLYWAISSGQRLIVEALIKVDADINFENHSGMTALILAILEGEEEIFRILIGAGADINYVTKSDISVLFYACYNENLVCLRELITANVDIDQSFFDGSNAFIECCSTGNEMVVKALIKGGANINQANSFNGETALMRACYKGYNSTVQLLINAAANVDQLMKDGTTALILACKHNHTSVIESLIKAGVDKNHMVGDGIGALSIAIKSGSIVSVKTLLNSDIDICQINYGLIFASGIGHQNIIQELLDTGANINFLASNETPLIAASKDGHTSIVDMLITNGASIDQCSKNGRTALSHACKEGHLEIVQALIKNGANVDKTVTDRKIPILLLASDSKNKSIANIVINKVADVNQLWEENGITALIQASINGNNDIVIALIEAGADVNLMRSDNGLTALMQASFNGHASTVFILLKNGANVNHVSTKTGFTALILACMKLHKHTIRILLDANAKFDLSTTEGSTPLIIASKSGNLIIVSMLVKAGADLHLVDEEDKTALMHASHMGHNTVIDCLIEAKADVNQFSTKIRMTALQWACVNGDKEIVKALIETGANVNHISKDGVAPLTLTHLHGHNTIAKILNQAGANQWLAARALFKAILLKIISKIWARNKK